MRATSDWRGVQPTRLASGRGTGVSVLDQVSTARVSGHRALVVWIQLLAGITRASSRMKRSQSKRVCAAAITEVSRCSLIEAKL